MKLRSLLLMAVIAFSFNLAVTDLLAEILSSTLRDMQDQAPEALRINVLAVDQQSRRREFEEKNGQKVIEETISVTASARVQSVLRTASGLTPGSVVIILYDIKRRTPSVPDARPPEILKPGETVRAYLSKARGAENYTPAAISQSFVRP